jgi:hypothetical protein
MNVDIPDTRILTPCEFVRRDLRKRPGIGSNCRISQLIAVVRCALQ